MYRHIFLVYFFLNSSLMEHQAIELYDRLHHLIGYVKSHNESQKPDLMLGIFVCEGMVWIMESYE